MVRNRICVCVIGLGRAGMIHARNFATAVPDAELGVMVDANPEALENALKEIQPGKCFTQWQQVLRDKDIDAIVVATPTDLHK